MSRVTRDFCLRVFAILVLFTLVVERSAHAGETLRVLVPDDDNLQYMSFWVARAGGFFEREGIDVALVVPPGPQQASVFFERREAEAAVLPAPMVLGLIASKQPVVVVANLLKNDPIDLVVRKSVLEARQLSPNMPLRDRLLGLKGLRLGVAPHPPTRLRALFASQGLVADEIVEIVILHGKSQNAAFAAKEVDALYAHTPFLERAIVHDDAIVLVDQNRGDVPELANRQIHSFAFQKAIVDTRPELVTRAVRALGHAEASIHASHAETVATLARAFPTRDRRELETIVRLYEPAIPATPDVRKEDVLGSIVFFPAGMPKPNLEGVAIDAYVAPEFAHVAKSEAPRRAWVIVAAVAAAVVVFMILALRRQTPAP